MAINTNVARLAVDWYGGAPPPREEFDFSAGVSLGVLVVNTLSVALWHIRVVVLAAGSAASLLPWLFA